MKILHIDLRSLTAEYADLRYSEDNLNTFEDRRLPLADIQDLIELMERDYFVALPEDYAKTGRRLYAWLDGSDRWLSTLLGQSGGAAVLAIATEQRLANLPWEVLHDGRGFLVGRSQPVVPVRWQASGANGGLTWQPADVPNRPLQVLFMATSPVGVKPVLDFEAEEGRILEATQRQPLTLTVEESGCLDELENLLASYDREHFDVVHLSGHALIGAEGPRFITETETGDRYDASPDDMAKALQFRFPALMFLSGCRTGQAGQRGEVPSMAAALLDAGAGAVLGWGRPVRDGDGILAAEALYTALSSASTLPEALAKTYQAMIAGKARDWHLLRLYVTGAMPQRLVTPLRTRGRQKAPKPSMATDFLDVEQRVKVPKRESFVGRRRELQACLKALRDPERAGVLIHGMGGLGKSSLAARLCDRLPEFERVVLFGALDEAGLVNSLAKRVRDSELQKQFQNSDDDLRYRLRDLFEASERAFLLVLDDFEANLEAIEIAGDGGFRVKAGEQGRADRNPAQTLGALMWALEEAQRDSDLGHRVLITCRYDFEFGGLARVYKQPLAGLAAADLDKKCRQLATFRKTEQLPRMAISNEGKQRQRALRLADGNPRLLEWLDKVLQHPENLGAGSVAAVLAELEREPAALREQVLAEVLIAQINESMREMLARATVYELLVPKEAIFDICNDIFPVQNLLSRAIALGLLEQSPQGQVRVPRVLQKEVISKPSEVLIAHAARVLYRLWWNDHNTEAQSLEIHRLATAGKIKTIAAEVTYALTIRWNSKSRFREVIPVCKQTLRVTSDYGVWHQLAKAELQTGEIDQAYASLHKALEACPNTDSAAPEKSSIIHNLAVLAMNKGETDRAVLLYQQSLEIRERIGDVREKHSTLHCLGIIKAEQQGELEEALSLYQEALLVAEEVGDIQGQAATLGQMANLYFTQGDQEKAFNCYSQTNKIAEEIGHIQYKASALHGMAIIRAEQGENEKAESIYRMVLDIDNEVGDIKNTAVTLHELGRLSVRKGEIDTAINFFQESLAIREKIGNARHIAIVLYDLANAEADKGNTKEAITLCQKLLFIKEQIGDVQGKAYTLHQLAMFKASEGEGEEAIALYNDSLAIKEKIGDVQGKAATLAMMGQLLADKKGDTTTAVSYLQESLTILQKIGSPDARTVQSILDQISKQ